MICQWEEGIRMNLLSSGSSSSFSCLPPPGESTDVSGAKERPFLSLLSLSSKSQMSPDCLLCVSLESSD